MRITLAAALSSLLLAVIPAKALVAQQPTLSEDAIAGLTGSWSGTIVVDQTISQDVGWLFERAASGELVGYMGPTAMGTPTIPMQNLASDGEELRFTVDSQYGEFIGRMSAGEATGMWRQGQSGPVTLTRAGVGQDDPDSNGGPYSPVVGRWEGRQGGSPDAQPMAYFRFALGDSGELIGFAGDAPEATTTPLQNVELTGSQLTFQAPAPAPSIRRFTGDISGDAAAGTWFQGIEAQITMKRTGPLE